MSELTGEALPYEDDMTLDDVERWVDENVPKDQHSPGSEGEGDGAS
jgi:hypothetical protein